MGRATLGRSVRRWVYQAFLLAVGVGQSGCYCADWRWIWEDDDDYCRCYYPPREVAAAAGDPGR